MSRAAVLPSPGLGRRLAELPAGEACRHGISVGLARIAAAGVVASDRAGDPRLTIACGGSTSELFLRPRLEELQRAQAAAVLRHHGVQGDVADRRAGNFLARAFADDGAHRSFPRPAESDLDGPPPF